MGRYLVEYPLVLGRDGFLSETKSIIFPKVEILERCKNVGETHPNAIKEFIGVREPVEINEIILWSKLSQLELFEIVGCFYIEMWDFKTHRTFKGLSAYFFEDDTAISFSLAWGNHYRPFPVIE